MLWILAAFLLILSLLLVQFLKTFISKVKDSYFVYPSDAVIDQALPQEIMENMMTFLDARAMIECRLVSKYWRHHAIKPKIETEALARARLRLREVYEELIGLGVITFNPYDDYDVERLINSPFTQDKLFLRASALANKYGGDLIVAGSGLFHQITHSHSWSSLKERKNTNTTELPWHFSLEGQAVNTKPVFDVTQVDWEDVPPHNLVDIMVDANNFPSRMDLGVNLYLYRAFGARKHFYFVPLSDQIFHVFIFLFSPMIAHDIIYSSYLSTIKSWFGPIMFMCAAAVQLHIISDITWRRSPNKAFKITLAVFLTLYIFTTYMLYPASMNAFATIGNLALMVFYCIIGDEYLRPYYGRPLSKKKRQVFIIGMLLIFLMIDWKLVVLSMADLTFFKTLFAHTVAYALTLLVFIFYCSLDRVNANIFQLRSLVRQIPKVSFLRNTYLLLILMTIIAPTWRGNYL